MVSISRSSPFEVHPVVETTSGFVSGIQTGGAIAFHGIPYGNPTDGARRFAASQPRTPWTGVLECSRPGSSAPQLPASIPSEFAWYWSDVSYSEDCLALSVYTSGLEDGQARPVMVWLHGGGFFCGAGTANGFDGTPLASSRGVVVVCVNHRLNLFGFLYPNPAWQSFQDTPGNVGMLDVVAALHWVRHNIRNFGGDPACVTVFGQSGGAAKVTALMQMQMAQGLFHRAIVQSGSGLLRLASRDEASSAGDRLLEELSLSADSVHRLRELPVDQLLQAMGRVIRQSGGIDNFRPVRDGVVFLDHPLSCGDRNPARDVPMLAGTVMDESKFVLAFDPANFHLDTDQILRRLQAFLRADATAVSALVAVYRSARPEASENDIFSAITTDFFYRSNTAMAAELKSMQGGAPAYLYRFDWPSPARDGQLGTPHTCEVPFIFGTVDAAAALTGQTADRERVMNTMMDLWVSFARTGAPKSDEVPCWPPYTRDLRMTMRLGRHVLLESDPGGAELAALRQFTPLDYGFAINFGVD